jgi:hypothetical protein
MPQQHAIDNPLRPVGAPWLEERPVARNVGLCRVERLLWLGEQRLQLGEKDETLANAPWSDSRGESVRGRCSFF